ncbi:MAG: phosphatase PAP2 family protein [Oscillospiraceae bacterium]
MKARKCFIISTVLFALFGVLIWAVLNVDVKEIGPNGSAVGLAAINGFMRDAVGVHLIWYEITDWLGLAAIFTAFGFALLGLIQLIKRKSLFKVDRSILVLGVYYVAVIGLYVLFETHIVNYRPILINGALEASFPSSHTMIVICIMGAAIVEFRRLIKSAAARKAASGLCAAVAEVTVAGRAVSGVHWFTDIIGGLLIGTAMILAFYAVTEKLGEKR